MGDRILIGGGDALLVGPGESLLAQGGHFSESFRNKIEAAMGASWVEGDDCPELVWIVELSAWDLVTGAEVKIYRGSRTYGGIPGFSCPAGYEGPNVTLSIGETDPESPGAFRSSGISFGDVLIDAGGGGREGAEYQEIFRNRTLANRSVKVYGGLLSDDWSDFEVVFPLLAQGEPLWDTVSEQWAIEVKSALFDSDQPFHERLDLHFKGLGGYEGGDSLAGRAKPYVYGEFYGHEAIALDTMPNWYLVHGGPEAIEEITTVYEGALVTVPDEVDLGDAGLGAAFKLNGTARYPIRVDGKGAKPGGTYIDRPGAIWQEILETHAGLSSTQIDINGVDDIFDEPVGVAISTGDDVRLGQLFERLLPPRVVSVPFLSGGKMQLVVRVNPATATISEAYEDDHIESISIQPVRRPFCQVYVGYQRRQPIAVVNPSSPLNSIELAEHQNEWRRAPSQRLESLYGNDRTADFESSWVSRLVALAEADALLELGRDPEIPYDVVCRRKPLFAAPGDVVSLRKEDGEGNARYGMDTFGVLVDDIGDPLEDDVGESLTAGDTYIPAQVVEVRADFGSNDFSFKAMGRPTA